VAVATQPLSLQPSAQDGSSFVDFSTLKMESIRSSETSVHTRATRRHIPEDDILHSHRRENIRSYMFNFLCIRVYCEVRNLVRPSGIFENENKSKYYSKEIKSRLNSGNVCCCLIPIPHSKNLRIKMYETVTLFLFCLNCSSGKCRHAT
jgi:hypothetical protein